MSLTCLVGAVVPLLIGEGGKGDITSAKAQLSRGEPAASAAEAMFCCNGPRHYGSRGPLVGEQARAEWARNTQGQHWVAAGQSSPSVRLARGQETDIRQLIPRKALFPCFRKNPTHSEANLSSGDGDRVGREVALLLHLAGRE